MLHKIVVVYLWIYMHLWFYWIYKNSFAMLCYHYAMLLLFVLILVRGVPSLNTSKGTDRAAMHGAFAVDDPPRGQPIM